MGAAGMTFVLMSANSRGGTDYGVVVALDRRRRRGHGARAGERPDPHPAAGAVVHRHARSVVRRPRRGHAAVRHRADPVPHQRPAQGVADLADPRAAELVLARAAAGRDRAPRSAGTPGSPGGPTRSATTSRSRWATASRWPRVKVINFVGAAGCSAFAGVLASIQIGAGSATVGIGSLFLTIAAVVIGGTALSGGKGGILRSALGVLLLTDPEQRPDPLGREPEHPVGRVRRRADRGDHRGGVAATAADCGCPNEHREPSAAADDQADRHRQDLRPCPGRQGPVDGDPRRARSSG